MRRSCARVALMFKGIVAVDVASRIPDFYARMREMVSLEPKVANKLESLEITKVEAQTIDGLLVSIYEDLRSEFLERLPALRYIGVLGTSTKKIDLEYCAAKSIRVSVVKEYCDEETAEWVMMQILKFFRERKEPVSAFGKTLGVIGFGSVGHKLARKAEGLGLTVLVNTRSGCAEPWAKASKEQIFAKSDVVSFHTPPHTAWLSMEELRHTKKDALLINTCLGFVDNGQDLQGFLLKRPDVTVIMDKVALGSYGNLGWPLFASRENAYETADSKKRLIERFIELISEQASLME